MCTTLLYSTGWPNIVNQLFFNEIFFNKKINRPRTRWSNLWWSHSTPRIKRRIHSKDWKACTLRLSSGCLTESHTGCLNNKPLFSLFWRLKSLRLGSWCGSLSWLARGRKQAAFSSHKGTKPVVRAPPQAGHTHNHLPEASPPHTIALAAEAITYMILEGHKHQVHDNILQAIQKHQGLWQDLGSRVSSYVSCQITGEQMPSVWAEVGTDLRRHVGEAWRFQGQEHLAKKGLSSPNFPSMRMNGQTES